MYSPKFVEDVAIYPIRRDNRVEMCQNMGGVSDALRLRNRTIELLARPKSPGVWGRDY